MAASAFCAHRQRASRVARRALNFFVDARTKRRNPSNGSAGFSDTGSMERPKLAAASASSAVAPPGGPMTAAAPGASSSSATGPASGAADAKRKKMEEAGKESRIDAKQVIDDLIKSANLEHDESAEGERPPDRPAIWRRDVVRRLVETVPFFSLLFVSVRTVSGLQLKDITKSAQSGQKAYGGIW